MQMFPEECFQEVDVRSVEELWGKERQWWMRSDVGDGGKEIPRVGWRCSVHGWGYWVRVVRFEEVRDGGGVGGEEGALFATL